MFFQKKIGWWGSIMLFKIVNGVYTFCVIELLFSSFCEFSWEVWVLFNTPRPFYVWIFGSCGTLVQILKIVTPESDLQFCWMWTKKKNEKTQKNRKRTNCLAVMGFFGFVERSWQKDFFFILEKKRFGTNLGWWKQHKTSFNL